MERDREQERRTGFVGIILEGREGAEEVNRVLAENARLILARLGLPRAAGGTPVIMLVVEATTDEMGALAGRLGKIRGLSVKSALAKRPKAPAGERDGEARGAAGAPRPAKEQDDGKGFPDAGGRRPGV